jgi:hypothetical protein
MDRTTKCTKSVSHDSGFNSGFFDFFLSEPDSPTSTWTPSNDSTTNCVSPWLQFRVVCPIIGHNVGIGHFDIINELNERSIGNATGAILNQLNPNDYASMCCVSKGWKSCVEADQIVDKQRIAFLKYKKILFKTAKENLTGYLQVPKAKRTSPMALSKLNANCVLNEKYDHIRYDINRHLDVSLMDNYYVSLSSQASQSSYSRNL